MSIMLSTYAYKSTTSYVMLGMLGFRPRSFLSKSLHKPAIRFIQSDLRKLASFLVQLDVSVVRRSQGQAEGYTPSMARSTEV